MNPLIIALAAIVIAAVLGAVIYLGSSHQNSAVSGSTGNSGQAPGSAGTTSAPAASQQSASGAATTTAQPQSNNLMVQWALSNGNYTARNITYCVSPNSQQGSSMLQLDLYANAPVNYSSASKGLRPIAVFIHGGGLTTGDKAQPGADSTVFPVIISYLINNGFVVASLNYNLAPSYKYPNQSDDVLCAMRFLRYYAKSFDGNPDQIAVFGDSSGGQLAAVIGVTNGTAPWENEDSLQISGATNLTNSQYLEISTRPQVVGDFYGSVNNTMFPGYTMQQVQQQYPTTYQNLLQVYNANTTLMYYGSPSQFVTSGEPNFLIFQGNNDTMVPPYISMDFYKNLLAHNNNATYIAVNNAGHRFVPTPAGSYIQPGLGYISNYTLSYFEKAINAQQSTTTIPSTSATTTASQSSSAPQAQTSTDFIVANPVNLSQISQISKFRSCAGHDYSGYDTQGYLETNRSMKHYFTPVAQLKGSVGRIDEYAPFNGTVQSITEEHTPVGKQVWVAYTSSGPQFGYPVPNVWDVVFFHMDPLPNVTVGSHVTAGQLIGHANQTTPVNQTFDIALEQYNGSLGSYRQVLDSIFNHMAPQVLSQFSAVGVNQGDIIIPKAYRDTNPCNFQVYNPNDSVALS